jgi:hypothetical protein
MTKLMNIFGVEGYGAYFILVEMCVDKMDKERDEEFTEAHCRFRFSERLIREKLRMRSTKVELFLSSCSTLDLLQFTKVEDEFNFYLPKLLEYLDRHSRKARPKRATSGPQAGLDKEQDKEQDKELSPEKIESDAKRFEERIKSGLSRSDFDDLFGLYPNFQKRTQSIALMMGELRDRETFELARIAITNFARSEKRLRRDLKYIPHLPTWWTGWRDWIKPQDIQSHSVANLQAEQRQRDQAEESRKLAEELEAANLTPEQKAENLKQVQLGLQKLGLKTMPKLKGVS